MILNEEDEEEDVAQKQQQTVNIMEQQRQVQQQMQMLQQQMFEIRQRLQQVHNQLQQLQRLQQQVQQRQMQQQMQQLQPPLYEILFVQQKIQQLQQQEQQMQQQHQQMMSTADRMSKSEGIEGDKFIDWLVEMLRKYCLYSSYDYRYMNEQGRKIRLRWERSRMFKGSQGDDSVPCTTAEMKEREKEKEREDYECSLVPLVYTIDNVNNYTHSLHGEKGNYLFVALFRQAFAAHPKDFYRIKRFMDKF
jgi:DNA repair exonuclease SbcCD ATPase subunit